MPGLMRRRRSTGEETETTVTGSVAPAIAAAAAPESLAVTGSDQDYRTEVAPSSLPGSIGPEWRDEDEGIGPEWRPFSTAFERDSRCRRTGSWTLSTVIHRTEVALTP
jgi:hypothetical protein